MRIRLECTQKVSFIIDQYSPEQEKTTFQKGEVVDVEFSRFGVRLVLTSNRDVPLLTMPYRYEDIEKSFKQYQLNELSV